jgi:ABC-type nitrate/sulfonate/bicarbonate transport system permease component
MVTAPRTTLPRWGPLRLALLDALIAGAGLGYLAHQYREALVANSAAIGLGLLLAFALGYVLRAAVRSLRRANSRVEEIFAEELPKKPSPRPR